MIFMFERKLQVFFNNTFIYRKRHNILWFSAKSETLEKQMAS